jgi:hypothetical protein
MIKKFEKDVYLKYPYYTTLIYEQAWTVLIIHQLLIKCAYKTNTVKTNS